MDVWKDLQLRKLACEKDLQTAYRLVLDFFNNQGFEYCAFAAYLGTPQLHTSQVNLNNYPYDWNKLYEQNGYISKDPVVAHCNQSTLPVLWNETLFARAPKHWRDLNRQGLKHGWTQSIHGQHDAHYSLFSVARSHPPLISKNTMQIWAMPSSPVSDCMPLRVKNCPTTRCRRRNITCRLGKSKS